MSEVAVTVAADDEVPSALAARLHAWRRGLYRFRQSWTSIAGLVIVGLLIAITLIWPLFLPYPDDARGAVHYTARFLPPSATHWFGTNEVGQDIFTLVIAGARVSVFAGLAIVVLSALIGVAVGGIAGVAGGIVDNVLMRITDFMLSVPQLILAMAVASAWGPGMVNMVFAITLASWAGVARLTRGEVIGAKENQYVTAAYVLGASRTRVLFRHILPNIVSPIIVKMSLDVGFAILTIASLGFIGIGVKPPTPEWGTLLSQARGYLPDYWWAAIFPGLAIMVTVMGFNLLGDGIRDVLDPRARR